MIEREYGRCHVSPFDEVYGVLPCADVGGGGGGQMSKTHLGVRWCTGFITNIVKEVLGLYEIAPNETLSPNDRIGLSDQAGMYRHPQVVSLADRS